MHLCRERQQKQTSLQKTRYLANEESERVKNIAARNVTVQLKERSNWVLP